VESTRRPRGNGNHGRNRVRIVLHRTGSSDTIVPAGTPALG
jgi:hypothetical protein